MFGSEFDLVHVVDEFLFSMVTGSNQPTDGVMHRPHLFPVDRFFSKVVSDWAVEQQVVQYVVQVFKVFFASHGASCIGSGRAARYRRTARPAIDAGDQPAREHHNRNSLSEKPRGGVQ